jgi:polyisoprenyl-phosphate glycosyltransferase
MSAAAPEYVPHISVVVPVFNSAATLEELFLRTQAALTGAGYSFEMIFVHDGGMEDSWDVISTLKSAHPKEVVAIRLARNFGQHNATMCGIHHAVGDYVVTIDDDLQHPPEEILLLLQRQQETGREMVYGVFTLKQHSWLRNLGSRALNKIFKHFASGMPNGSSFRLLTRNLAQEIGRHRLPFVFLDQIIAWYTHDVELVLVRHEKRREGKSGYSYFGLVAMAINFIVSYTDIPLKLMVWIGLLSSVVSLTLGTTFIILKLVNDAAVGFTALITVISFSASVILLSLGILGEYIGRLYAERHERPVYHIKTKL